MGALNERKAPAPPEDTVAELNLRLLKLEHRFQRERAARLHAEAIAEKGLRDLYERQQQLVLLETIATVANQSRSVEETLRVAVRAVCDHTGWSYGNAYRLATAGPPRLTPADVWHAADPDRLAPFIALNQQAEFVAGQGLPGRVLGSGRAAWIADVAEDDNFPRADAARACGLHAAFAFPVLVGHDVLGVLEFFHREPVSPDEQLLGVVGQIGTQLGRVVERRRAEDKLMHDASHDPLTGLPNRLLFVDRLERAVAAHRRRSELGFAVLFIDLVRFKLVNDSMGHAAGDDLLVQIAGRFGRVVSEARGADAAPLVATLARLGGDEFTVLLEDVGGEAAAIELAEALQETLRRPFQIEGQDIFTSASFGVASCAAGYAGADEIMRDADLAMYRAKAEGRARIEVFDQSLLADAKRRLATETDLRNAVRNKEFILHYQPIFALDGERLVGFEALIRWRRADGEIAPPSDFIGIAEETGLIVFIGQWVMQEAFATLAAWRSAYPEAGPVTMSVNVSPRQFHQPDFVGQVMAAVRSSGVDPSAVRLEITESVTIQDARRTKSILDELRAQGVRVSIDDFGTGYSSLSYLQQLSFDTLKIDRSFVTALKGAGGEEIVRTILDLARSLEMDVVAEGAETAAHVEQLREMGCGFAQGYFFARPLEREAAAALLAAASTPDPGAD